MTLRPVARWKSATGEGVRPAPGATVGGSTAGRTKSRPLNGVSTGFL